MLEKYSGNNRTQIEEYLDRILESSPEDLVYGTGAWYEPSRFETGNTFFGPYVHRGDKKGDRVLTYEWTTQEYNFHQQGWYLAGVQAAGKPAFTEPYLDAGTVYMTMALSFRDRKDGTMRGVISVDMILPQLQELIESVNRNSTDVIYMVGKSGKILAYPQAEQFLKNQQAISPAANYKGMLDIPEVAGLSAISQPLIYSTQMEENDWKIVVASPEDVILASYRSTKSLIYICLLAYLLAAALTFGIVYYFTEKVRALEAKSIEAIRHEKNQLAAIVDNVSFGLLRADSNGEVQDGFSKSCAALLGRDPNAIRRASVWDLLGMSARDRENYQAFFQSNFRATFPG